MRIIGIHGKARSGKDEFCKILCDTYGFKRIAFADIIRELGIKYYNLDREEIMETKTKESRQILQGIGVSVRNNISKVRSIFKKTPVDIGLSGFPRWAEEIAVQEFSVEEADLRRKLKYIKTVLSGTVEMWSSELTTFEQVSNGEDKEIWVNYLLNQPLGNDVYVIPDVRFKNEYQKLQDSAFAKTVKIFRVDNPPIEAGSTHSSETQLEDVINWDFKVVNEHKMDWRDRLVLSASNLVRKFKHNNFFTDEDLEKFKINIEWA